MIKKEKERKDRDGDKRTITFTLSTTLTSFVSAKISRIWCSKQCANGQLHSTTEQQHYYFLINMAKIVGG